MLPVRPLICFSSTMQMRRRLILRGGAGLTMWTYGTVRTGSTQTRSIRTRAILTRSIRTRAILTSLLLAFCAGTLTACSGGGKVNETLTDPEALRNSQQAIAFLRLTTPDPSCVTVALNIGVREGDLYRPQQTLRLQQTAVTNVLEMLLAPGDYHVLGFACYRARSTLILAEPQGDGRLRRSYGSFSVAAGEVVNLGQIKLARSGRSTGIFNSFVDVAVEISDWPVSELERFKSQRPKHYAEMRTRLMTAAPPVGTATPEAVDKKCADVVKLHSEGKLQNLPASCVALAIQPKA